MLTIIKNLEELEMEASEIDAFMNITISEDINECSERGADLLVYMARTGKMLADAKYWQDHAISIAINSALTDKPNLSPSILSKLVSSSSQNENYLVNWIERLNRGCVHQLDFIRTMISKNKAEMQYQNFQK